VAHDRWLCLALGLILGGTLGNLYDRLVFGGVRDFLHCYYDTHIWPDFNLADCCLVCGAGVLLAHSFLVSEPAAPQAKTEAASTAAPVPVETTSPTPGG
jgi:lipoprotein signal peptidase